MLQALDGGTTKALGPLSRALGVDGWVFVAGTVGTFDDGTLPPTVGEQTAQTLENVRAHLAEGGLTLDDVVSTTVYLTRRDQYADMNAAYERYFTRPYPARATVVCDLVHEEHLVEISAVARHGARA
ncbi:MAG TPA: RidA family protein [Solirubrobacter sp.]|nr:RidA family protein [Solirubrobacter sp.]